MGVGSRFWVIRGSIFFDFVGIWGSVFSVGVGNWGSVFGDGDGNSGSVFGDGDGNFVDNPIVYNKLYISGQTRVLRQ